MSMIDNLDEYIVNVNREREETLTPRQVRYMKEVETDKRFDDPKYRELVDVLNRNFAMRHPENGFHHNVETMATQFITISKVTMNL